MYYYVRPEWSLSYLMYKSRRDAIDCENSDVNKTATSNQKEAKTFANKTNNDENFKETPENTQQQLKTD